MNSQKHVVTRETVLLLLLLTFGINSCKKSNSNKATNKDGPARIIVNMLGADETGSEPLAKINGATSGGKLAVYSEKIQQTVIPFDQNISIVATLVPVGTFTGSETNNAQIRTASTKLETAATDTPKISPLAANVKYKVLVYDAAGTYVTSKDYTSGQTINPLDKTLDGEKNYIFAAVSQNTGIVPAVNSVTNPTAVNNTSGDLMYFNKHMKLTAGDNYLDIILKHQYSQITTNIAFNGGPGNITAISGVTLGPSRNAGNINLVTGALSYNVAGTANITFPAIVAGGVRSISSGPKVIINEATAAGILKIGAITVNGVTKQNISIPNLSITPGVRYNLNVSFQIACTQDSNPSTPITNNSAQKPVTSVTITSSAADYGFQFDITRLDNSFNMVINDVPLIAKAGSTDHELQFETYPGGGEGLAYYQNIKFADGGEWGVTTGTNPVPQIYNMIATSIATPIIRLLISSTGVVTMYGSKVKDGPLFPLSLIPGTGNGKGYVFNTIPWNIPGDNKIVITQKVNNGTILLGSGVGKKVVACTN